MGDEAGIGQVRRFVDEFDRGDLESIRRFIAPEWFTHPPGEDEPTATEVFLEFATDLRAAFPDLALAIEGLDWTDDRLTGRVTFSGTSEAPLWGVPATGRRISWTVPFTLRPVGDRFAVNLEGVTPPVAVGLLRELELVNPPDEMDRPPRHPVVFPDFLLRLAFTGQVADRPCPHLDEIRFTEPATDVCAQCVAAGDIWPALRMCLVCGFVGCCDTSKNKHMKAHSEATGHPIFRSIRMDEGWIWCYEDNAFFQRRTLERYRPAARA